LDPRWKRAGLQLTLAEILSLRFGRTLFNFLDGTSFAADLDGALERLEPAISGAHSDLVRQLDTKFIAVSEHAKDYRGEHSDTIDDLVTALVYSQPIDARYRKPSGVTGTYHLHPYTLGVYRQGLYLFAFDVDAGQVKTFAVERFESDLIRRKGETFQIPTGWSPRAYIAHAFGIMSGTPEEVVLAVEESSVAYVRERTWHPTQTFRTLPDGRLELRMQVGVTVELETWIRGFGADMQVISPPPLVQRIGESLRRAAARYATPRSVMDTGL
jgi:proteasome accessory factor B